MLGDHQYCISRKNQSRSFTLAIHFQFQMDRISNHNTSSKGAKLPNEVKHLIAGGLAGMVAKTFVAPIDRIKILYQVTSAPFRLRDVPHVASQIIKQEGLSGLWKGNTVTMIRVFPYAGIQFMVFNRVKSYFIDGHEHEYLTSMSGNERILANLTRRNSSEKNKMWAMTTTESLIAGSSAGAVSVLATYPLDLTRAQLAVLKKQKGRRNVFLSVLFSNYGNGGMGGLFRGITPTLLGMLPYAGVAFTINEQAKRQIYDVYKRDPTIFEKMMCGGLSGLFAQSITYPFEVTRRRMQTIGVLSKSGASAVNVLGGNVETKVAQNAARLAEHAVEGAQTKSPSMFRIMKQVMAEQGVGGFFKGLSMNWVKGPISFAFSFTVFDLIKERIDHEEREWRQTI